jgi:hypothetical protein
MTGFATGSLEIPERPTTLLLSSVLQSDQDNTSRSTPSIHTNQIKIIPYLINFFIAM